MTTLRLAAAQLHYHPAFEGGGHQALREPTGAWEGAGLSGLRAGTEEGDKLLRQLRERVEKVYVEAYRPRLEAVVRFCAGLDINLLVLPEYSVPLALLPAVAEAAGEKMTVVAGSHTVTPEGVRKSGIYEALGLAARPAIGSAIAPVVRGGRIVAAVAKLSASRWEPELVAGSAWEPVTVGGEALGVLICLDFLRLRDGEVGGKVGARFDGCALFAVPSLTPMLSVEHFAKNGEEVIYGYGRPVVYANRAREGGTRIFAGEAQGEHGAGILTAGAPPVLAAGVEGVVMAEVRFGEARERYRPVVGCRPIAAAVVMEAQRFPGLRAAAEGVLAAREAEEAFARVEAAEGVFREAAGDGRLPAIARERWGCLGGGVEGITTVGHLHALARDVWVEGVSGWREVEKGLVEGAVKVLREVEKKAPEAQRVVTVRGWLDRDVLTWFDGVVEDEVAVETLTEDLVSRPRAVPPQNPVEDGSFGIGVTRLVQPPQGFTSEHVWISWGNFSEGAAESLREFSTEGPTIEPSELTETPPFDRTADPNDHGPTMSDLRRAARVLALCGAAPEWLGWSAQSDRKDVWFFASAGARIVQYASSLRDLNSTLFDNRPASDALPLGMIDEPAPDSEHLPAGIQVVQRTVRRFATNEGHLKILSKFRDSPEGRRFVEPDARLRGGDRAAVLDQLEIWLRKRSSFCLLLGEFGIGKSTVSRQFAARLAHAAVNGDARPVIFVNLHAWSDPLDLGALVRRALGVDDVEPYRLGIEEGECILLLDGFDEMSNRITPAKIPSALRELLAWRTERSKILLTCRTHLFIDPADLHRVVAEAIPPFRSPVRTEILDAMILELQLFDETRILAYLRHVMPNPEFAWEAMGKVHDLRNLAERPLLLSLIRDTLPWLQITQQYQEIKLGDLYETYVQRWAEWAGTEEWLSPTEKIAFAEILARCIWKGEDGVEGDSVHWRTLAVIFTRELPESRLRALEGDAALLELRGSSFVVWRDTTQGGYYRFAHGSFLEYMLARRTVRMLGEGDRSALSLPRLSPEVIAYCKTRPQWGAARREAATLLMDPYRDRVSENALLLVVGEDGIGSSVDRPWLLQRAQLSRVSLRGASLNGARLEEADLTGADLAGASMIGAELAAAVLSEADLSGADFRCARMPSVRAVGANLDGTRFDGADLRETTLEKSTAFMQAPRLATARLGGANIAQAAWKRPTQGAELCGLMGAREARWRCEETIREGRNAHPISTAKLVTRHRSGAIGILAFSRDGKLFATAGEDCVVRIWDMMSGRMNCILDGHTANISAVSFLPDGQRVVTASLDQTARMWDARTGRSLHALHGHTNALTAVECSPHGEYIATASSDRTARVWETGTGRPLCDLSDHTNRVTSVSFSPDGRHIATSSDDKTVCVWDTRTGRRMQTIHGHTKRVTSVTFSLDGQHVVSMSDDYSVRAWELGTWRLVLNLHGRSWGLGSGPLSFSLVGHMLTTAVAFSPVKHLLATATSRTLWLRQDGDGGRHVLSRTLDDSAEKFTAAAFSPDGSRLVTSSSSGVVQIWDVSSGNALATFMHIPSGGLALAGPYVLLSGDVDLSGLVVQTGTSDAPLELYADLCFRPEFIADTLAGKPIPPLHIPMDTAERAVVDAVDPFLRPCEFRSLSPIRSNTTTAVQAPWALAPELTADPGFRLTLRSIFPDGTVHALDATSNPLILPPLPPGIIQLLLTLHLAPTHERSFTFPLAVLAQTPYIAGPPVRGDNLIGRGPNLSHIRTLLQHGSVRLVGERRIGKTSLLHHLLDHPGAHTPIWLNAEEKLDTPFRDWVTAAARHHLPDAPASPADLIPFLRGLAASGRPPLLLIDGIVHLRGLAVSDAAWLRSLSSPPIVAVLAGSAYDWRRFFDALPDEAGSPFNLLQDAVLGPLTEPEMRRLVARPGAAPPDDDALRRILELSDGRPYLAQRLCQAALNRVNREERMTITQADVNIVAREALVTGMDHQHKKHWAELAGAPNVQRALVAHAREGARAPRKLYDALHEHGLSDGKAWTVDPAFVLWILEREGE